MRFEQGPTLAPSPAASATLHDVAREALTNAMKHAPGIPVSCSLHGVGGVLELVVSNGMPTVPAGGPSVGRGSHIMASRMRDAGGTINSRIDGGAYVVTARLPPMSEIIRVAVVDDQAPVREAYSTILDSRADIAVVATGADGEDAVVIAAQHSPDVVLMDVRMPKLDGIAATRAIVAGGGGPRVLVVTTFNLDAYVYEALQAGASGFMLKDSTPQQLVEAVRTVARGEAIVDPAVTRALIGRHAERIRRESNVPAKSTC